MVIFAAVQQWGNNTFCWYKHVQDAQHGFLFLLQMHFTTFCKINKYFIRYQCSRAVFILKAISDVQIGVTGTSGSSPGVAEGGDCTLTINPTPESVLGLMG